MKPTFKIMYNISDVVDHLKNEIEWLSLTEARHEYFMSDRALEYTYGSGSSARTYKSNPFHPLVEDIMNDVNDDFGTFFDICFLNRYDNERQWLGWHSDNSPEIDQNHPIAVVSFGATRDLYVKEIGFKGEIPEENKYALSDGSLFIMPSRFQQTHLHKIPKCDRPCRTRISLTFRKYKENKNESESATS